MSHPHEQETLRLFERISAGPVRTHELKALTGLSSRQISNRLWPMMRDGAIVSRRVKTLHVRGSEREFELAATDEGPQAPTASRSKRTRACMCCEKPFVSEGPHNRLCYDCRRKAGDVSPYHPDH